MEPAGVLDDGALPGDWHDQQEGVEAWVVEPFAEVPSGCQDEPGLVFCLLSELCHGGTSCLRLDTAVKNDEARYLVADGLCYAFQVLAALGEDDYSAAIADELTDVGEDQA